MFTHKVWDVWGTDNVRAALEFVGTAGGTMGPRPQFSRESYVSARRIFFSRPQSEWVTQQLSGTWSGTAAELFGKSRGAADGRRDGSDGRTTAGKKSRAGTGAGPRVWRNAELRALEINWCRWRPQPRQRQLGVTSYLSSTPIRI